MHGETGPRWPGAAGRQCRVRDVMWTAQDESAWPRVLWDVTQCYGVELLELHN